MFAFRISAVKNSRVRRAVDGSGENKAGTLLAVVVRSKFMVVMPCGLVIDKVLYHSQSMTINLGGCAGNLRTLQPSVPRCRRSASQVICGTMSVFTDVP